MNHGQVMSPVENPGARGLKIYVTLNFCSVSQTCLKVGLLNAGPLPHCTVLHRDYDGTALRCRMNETIHFNLKCRDAVVTLHPPRRFKYGRKYVRKNEKIQGNGERSGNFPILPTCGSEAVPYGPGHILGQSPARIQSVDSFKIYG